MRRIIKTTKTFTVASLTVFATMTVAAQSASDKVALSQFEQSVGNLKATQQAAPKTVNHRVVHPDYQRIVLNPAPKQQAPMSQSAGVQQLTSGATAMPMQQPSTPTFSVKQPTVQQLMKEQPTYDQKAAYGNMLHQAMPMTPSQIIDLKRRMAAAQRASSASAEAPPQPVTSSRILNLAPGSTPPTIRLQKGFISTLDFVDASGSPWPISYLDNGNPTAFNVSWDKKSNTLMIQALKPYTYGNLAVTLKGLSTPIMLTLIPGQRQIDYRVDMRVSGLAPGSSGKYTNMSNLPGSANQLLLQVLDGVAPKGSKQLKVDGDSAQVWEKGNKLFVRSKFAILSPGWVGHMRSPDGTNAYELQKTPMILVSQFGNPVEVKIQGL